MKKKKYSRHKKENKVAEVREGDEERRNNIKRANT